MQKRINPLELNNNIEETQPVQTAEPAIDVNKVTATTETVVSDITLTGKRKLILAIKVNAELLASLAAKYPSKKTEEIFDLAMLQLLAKVDKAQYDKIVGGK